MHLEWIQIALAFLEGIALIASPCILPILPIILSGSLGGKKSRPLGIIVGFILAFAIVTLFSKFLIDLLHLPPDALRNASLIILFILGIVMLSGYLTEKFTLATQRLTRVGSGVSAINNPESGFLGGVLFGALVGIVWTPCAGPILAAVIVQVVTQMTTLNSLLTVIAFAIGAGIPMLLIALLGRQILMRVTFLRDHTDLIRKLLGFIIILSVLFIAFSTSTIASLSTSNQKAGQVTSLTNGLERPYDAPAIEGIDAWINSPPINLDELKGKVVLIDFWTYSCINCIRTLPYLKDWYAKYHDKGFVIIGIHSPEFQFEHDLNNVKEAVKKFGITYPVALDNRFMTWKNFHNQYWPAHFLISKEGKVVYQHFGEGEYEATENNIRYLLGLTDAVKGPAAEDNYSFFQTPETYLGYARAGGFAGPGNLVKDLMATYIYPEQLAQDKWALSGKWLIKSEKIVAATPGAAIKIHFYAKKVFAVMATIDKTVNVKVLLNGQPLKTIEVSRDQLYPIFESNQEQSGVLELITQKPGLEIYTFTFGS